MFSRLNFALPALLVAATVGASIVPRGQGQGQDGGSCNTGAIQCCQDTVKSDSAEGNALTSLLGLVLKEVVGLGLSCSPINVLPIGGSQCSAQTVCCEDNSYGGLISIGCLPVIL